MIFDLFSSRYGWSTQEILNMTFFELYWRLDIINGENTTDSKQSYRSELSEEKQKDMDRALIEAQKRIQKRFEQTRK